MLLLIRIEVSHKETDSEPQQLDTRNTLPLSTAVYIECRLIQLEESFSRFDASLVIFCHYYVLIRIFVRFVK